MAPHRDALSQAVKVHGFSTTVVNPSTEPYAFTASAGFVMFWSYSEGLMRTDGTPAGTRLVADLNPFRFASAPGMAALNGKGYFGLGGVLWVSDGTPEGTQELMPLPPPQTQAVPTTFNGSLYLALGSQLYKSDGTAGGTQLLAQANVASWGMAMGTRLYFACVLNGAATGHELCATDGTLAGTVMVADVLPGPSGSFPLAMGVVNNKLIFSAISSNNLRGVYATDGTAAGTSLLIPAPATGDVVSEYAHEFAVLDGNAFFPCYTLSAKNELCRTDGTVAGTSVLDLAPGSISSNATSLALLGNALFFRACVNGSGCELWSSDGTLAGSALFKDVLPGSFDGLGSGPLVRLDNALYFSARATPTHYALWKTDGTVAGTVLVKDFLPAGAPERYPFGLQQSIVFGSQLLFPADDGVHGNELWSTEGTPERTAMLKDLTPDQTPGDASNMVSFNDWLLVGANDGDGSSAHVWSSDGTTAGTTSLGAFRSTNALTLFPFSRAGSRVLFFNGGFELWGTDGSAAGTDRITSASSVSDVASTGSRAFFSATTPSNYIKLWQSDGTTAGTVVVTPDVLDPRGVRPINDSVYMSAGGVYGYEPWRGDGTAGGTALVRDINPAGDSNPEDFTVLGSQILFSANDGATGFELWKTDGTEPGTVQVADICPGSCGSHPFDITAFNGTVIYLASPSGSGPTALWRSDGTAAGTVEVKALDLTGFQGFAVWGQYAFFAASDSAGAELWRTDGTATGTVRVADIYPGPRSSWPELLTLVAPSGPLVFTAQEPVAGRELWMLATPLGTPTLAADVSPGPRSSSPTLLTASGPTLYFAADDGAGRALFKLTGLAPDTTPPRLTCPADVTVTTSIPGATVVSYPQFQARDDSGQAPTVTPDHASGSAFPVGATSITATASDSSGNTSRCSFTVTVVYTGGDAGTADGGTGSDGGAPARDGGTGDDGGAPIGADGGADGGGDNPQPDTCGCQATTTPLWAPGLLWLALAFRARARGARPRR